jgi:hypothetical protein
MMETIPFPEYTKIVDKFAAKSIFNSICSTHEGNQQVKETKTNLFVQQYELFKMMNDEDIETKYQSERPKWSEQKWKAL